MNQKCRDCRIRKALRRLAIKHKDLQRIVRKVKNQLAFITMAPFAAAGINFDRKRKPEGLTLQEATKERRKKEREL